MKKLRSFVTRREMSLPATIGKIMRLSLFTFVFLAMMSIMLKANPVFSQQLNEVKISLHVENQSVAATLAAIEKKTVFRFIYNVGIIDKAPPVNMQAREATVSDILKQLLAPAHLTFQQTGINVVITADDTGIPGSAIETYNHVLPIKITGRVISSGGLPLPGVSIKVKGSTLGAITDIKGSFSLAAEPGTVLIISYLGYETQEITVNDDTPLNIVMEPVATGLSQLVVVGYGVQKKSDITGAISSIKGESLDKMATTNPIDAMQGKVAGLTVTRTGGNPGEEADIRIRGIGTFGNHQPLFIIDGIPGDPYYLSNNDIASMEVLKDAAAAAIYGSRAANGVVLITTKSGQKGAPVIDANLYYGWVSPAKKYHLLDANGYRNVHKMMYENAGITQADWPAYITQPSDINTNWQDEIAQQGISQNYNAAIRGGGEYVTYSLSGNLTNEAGTMIGSEFNKKSVHSKTGIHKGIFDIQLNISYAETKNEGIKFTLRDAYYQSPLLPVYDTSAQYGYALRKDQLPTYMNPLGADHFLHAYNTTQYFVGNVSMKLNLFKGFDYTANLGYRNSNEFDDAYNPPYWINYNDPPSLYPYVYNQRTNWKEKTMEHLFHYQHAFGQHHIQLMAGATATSQSSAWLNASAEGKSVVRTVDNGNIVEKEVPAGFLDPGFNTIDAGQGGTFTAGGSRYTYNRTSLLGRINYDYAGKYLVQFSIRRDGSSKFGTESRYGVFPSAALGWRMTEESFMKNISWLSNLKLRASYGKLGNEGVLGYYEHQALISTGNDWTGGYVQGTGATPWQGAIARDLENRKLQWETVTSTNFGADFGILQDRISGSVNYYRNRTTGLLIYKEVAPSAGVNNPILNVGEMQNQGIELELNYRDHAHKLRYDITGTFSTLKNKVLQLANEGQILYGTGLKFGVDHIPTQTRVGKEVGAFYLYQTDGIFKSTDEIEAWNKAHNDIQPDAKPGDIRFLDENNDGVLDENDKIYSGSGLPKIEYGLNVNLGYGQFDLSMFWQGVTGNKIYNGNRFELEGMDVGRNFLTKTINAWTPQHPNSSEPRAVLGDPNGNNRESTRFLENGAYLRLKTLQLGYTLPQSLSRILHLNRLRVYASGQNLLTITKYSGLDPEIGRVGVLDTGVDRMLYPQTKTILVGLQLTL